MVTDTRDPTPDRLLIARARDGDADAFAVLWSRHAPAGHRFARRFTSSFDPDDLVAEAFLQILRALRNGRGPTSEFRPYLLATIRNQARSWGRMTHEVAFDDLDHLEAVDGDTSDHVVRAIDQRTTAMAFRSLPPRWQRVLWLVEVEHLTPAVVSGMMGITPNNVSSLAFRAREALRDAWVQLQVAELDAGRECTWSRERLGAYSRGHLSPSNQSRVRAHLSRCAACTHVAQETIDTVAPLLAALPTPPIARRPRPRGARPATAATG